MDKNLVLTIATVIFLQNSEYAYSQSVQDQTVRVPEQQSVFIAGTRDPDWKTYKAFVAGMNAFDANHKMAPQSDLRFILRPRSHQVDIGEVKMTIESDEIKIHVPVSDSGIFVLPRNETAAENGAEIFLSKKRNLLSWRPSIHTPGLANGVRRLGDLRLECIVRWSIEQADMLAFFRGVMNAVGGPCSSSFVKVDYISVEAVTAVYLVSEKRREKLASKWIEEGGHIYLPPVHDQSWPDDTLLEFEYVNSNPRN